VRRKYFSADGVIHTAISEDKAPRLDHSPQVIEKMNRDKNVCLNCKKKKCNGSEECFNEQRKIMNCK
jgi:hypothetical protein